MAIATFAVPSQPIVVRANEIQLGWRLPNDDADEGDECIPLDDVDLIDVGPLPPRS